MINLNKQVEILADVDLRWREHMELDENWVKFFNQNNLAFPFCTLNFLGLADWPENIDRRVEITKMIRETFLQFCDVLNIERGRNHLSVEDMFRASPNFGIEEKPKRSRRRRKADVKQG